MGKKANFDYRLTSLDRAQEAGLDDVGIGALIGLYDWRFEVMGLVRHTNHLEACYNVGGPHTISFPRIKDASMLQMGNRYFASDEDFARLVAILRLAVPYTGMILTAREPAGLRNELIQYGVSQIDGGTKIELGGYLTKEKDHDLNRGTVPYQRRPLTKRDHRRTSAPGDAAIVLHCLLPAWKNRRALYGVFSTGIHQTVLYSQCYSHIG